MRRHAKASSAGSTQGSSRSVRRAFATRGASSGAKGRGAPSLRLIALAAVVATAFLALTASASAKQIHVFSESFGSAGSGAGQLQLQPHVEGEPKTPGSSLAIDQETGDLYVADTGNHRVDQFDEAGNFIRAFGADVGGAGVNVCTLVCAAGTSSSAPGGFEAPTFISVDNAPGGEGDLYVADTANNLISKFEPDGTLISSWGTGGQIEVVTPAFAFNRLAGIAVDSAGNLDATIWEPGTLFRFSRAGSLLNEIPTSVTPLQRGLGIDPAGDLFTAHGSRLEKFAPDGTDIGTINLEYRLGGPPAVGLSGLAVDSANGDLYADVESGAIDQYRFNGAGEVTQGGGACPVLPSGPGCAATDSFGSTEAAGGELTQATGLAVNETSKAVYVANSGKQRLNLYTAITLPDVTTTPATEVKAHSAQLNGEVNPANGGEVTSCQFAWGTTAALEETPIPCEPPTIPDGGSFVPESVTLPTQPNTTYCFRLEAGNANGVNPGLTVETRCFTTPGPAEIEATFATEVSADSALLGAQISLHGVPTTYRFQYGTTTAYGEEFPDASLGSGTGEAAVSQPLQGLQAATTYHYRVLTRAEVEPGVFEEEVGPDASFTTQGPAALTLLDARQYQLVSPVDKRGARIEAGGFDGGIVQAAAAGGAISYLANAPTEASPSGYGGRVQVLSSRGPSGWSSRDIANPHIHATGAAHAPPEYNFFSSDLSSGLFQLLGVFEPGLSAEASEQTPFLRALAGCASDCYRPLVTAANALPGFGEEAPCRESGVSTVFGECGPRFVGSSPDLRHVVLLSAAPLLPGAPTGNFYQGTPHGSLYEWSAGKLSLVSVLPENELGEELPAPVGTARLGKGLGAPFEEPASGRRAISADGSRVFWAVQGAADALNGLYLRDTAGGETLRLDRAEAACEAAGECKSGGGRFQIAAADGTSVLFTDANRLTEDGANGGDLYECKIVLEASGKLACQLTDLTPKASVLGNVLGASEDGSSVYLVTEKVLASNRNSQGDAAIGSAGGEGTLTSGSTEVTGLTAASGAFAVGQTISGQGIPGDTTITALGLGTLRLSAPATQSGPKHLSASAANLFLLHEGVATFIATLASGDETDWGTRAESQPVRVSASGRWLTFMSERSLTGYDNRDASSGRPDAEVYLYDASTAKLRCASCDPSGARPHGNEVEKEIFGEARLDIEHLWSGSGWVAAITPANPAVRGGQYQSRSLSAAGRLFFESLDSLLPQDVNHNWDVYEYEPRGVGDCGPASPGYQGRSEACLGLLTSGASGNQSVFLDASESGQDVFFLTSSRLVPTDIDAAGDVYDAHECSAEVPCFPPPPPSPPACAGDACQLPAVPPNHPTPGTLTLNGPENVLECPKAKKLKGGKCVKQKSKKKHHKKSNRKKGKNQKRAASHKGGGGK